MYIIISPSKTQDFARDISLSKGVAKLKQIPEWNEQIKKLSKIMKQFSAEELSLMMKISSKLAQLNFERFQNWDGNYDKNKNAIAPAIVAFLGDVYRGFDLENWKTTDYSYAHKHLGIISGLYGLISPLNYIQPYRLEMGTRMNFSINKGAIGEKNISKDYRNLYDFWSELLTDKIIKILTKERVLVNLASVEYSKVVDRKKLAEEMNTKVFVIDVDFKISKVNKKTGKREEKIIAIYAKRARGLMANWIITTKSKTPKNLEAFNEDGWKFKGWSEVDTLGSRQMLFVKNV